MQVTYEGREGYVQDRVVHVDDEGGGTQHHQRRPTLMVLLLHPLSNREKSQAHGATRSLWLTALDNDCPLRSGTERQDTGRKWALSAAS